MTVWTAAAASGKSVNRLSFIVAEDVEGFRGEGKPDKRCRCRSSYTCSLEVASPMRSPEIPLSPRACLRRCPMRTAQHHHHAGARRVFAPPRRLLCQGEEVGEQIVKRVRVPGSSAWKSPHSEWSSVTDHNKKVFQSRNERDRRSQRPGNPEEDARQERVAGFTTACCSLKVGWDSSAFA